LLPIYATDDTPGRFWAIRHRDSLRSPAIFSSWEDCSFYVDTNENVGRLDYKAFDNIMNAVEYILPAPLDATTVVEAPPSTAAKTPGRFALVERNLKCGFLAKHPENYELISRSYFKKLEQRSIMIQSLEKVLKHKRNHPTEYIKVCWAGFLAGNPQVFPQNIVAAAIISRDVR
jgi:hypothetical protein